MKKLIVLAAVLAFSAIGMADHHEGGHHGMKKGKEKMAHKGKAMKMKKKMEKNENKDAAGTGTDTGAGAGTDGAMGNTDAPKQ